MGFFLALLLSLKQFGGVCALGKWPIHFQVFPIFQNSSMVRGSHNGRFILVLQSQGIQSIRARFVSIDIFRVIHRVNHTIHYTPNSSLKCSTAINRSSPYSHDPMRDIR